MKEFFNNNKTTLLVAFSTLLLGGVALFTAVRLYQLRSAPITPTAPATPFASEGDQDTIESCDLFTFSIGVPDEPAIGLVKEQTSNLDEDGSGDVTQGDTLTYSFVATNTGTQELTNVTIADPLEGLSALTCTPQAPATLGPSETLSCTATYVVTAADLAEGSIVNTATVSSNEAPDETDTVSVPVQTVPSIDFSKSLDGNDDEDGTNSVTAGDTLTYRFTLTNTGEATLTGATISDPLPGLHPLVCTPEQPATLAPTETLSCITTYVVTSSDEAKGSIENTATGDTDQTPEKTDSENVTVENPPESTATATATSTSTATAEPTDTPTDAPTSAPTDSPTDAPTQLAQATPVPTSAPAGTSSPTPAQLPAAGGVLPTLVGVVLGVVLLFGMAVLAI